MEEGQTSKSNKNSSLVWGVLLIVVGVFSLLSKSIELEEDTWVLVLAGLGVLALGFYLVDRSRLANLLPSYILFGVAGLVYLATNSNLEDGNIAVYIPGVAAFPFLDSYIAVYILGLVAVPFVVGYISSQNKNFGMLIPPYVMAIVSGIILIAEGNIISEDFIPTYILSAIALPFLIGYLRDPAKNKGLLVPAYVLLAIGIMLLLIIREVLDDLLIPAYIMFTVALPFFWAYFRNREKVGLLIPAGVLSLVGLSFLLVNESLINYAIPVILILAGIAMIMRKPGSKRGESPS